MGYDLTEEKVRSSSNRGIILAIVLGAIIIGVGLAVGLAIGLQKTDDNDEAPTVPAEAEAETDGPQYKSGNGRYRFATVVADATYCSKIGTEVMARHRGNVVDATVATVICDGVMNAHSAGIGGGAFFIYYDRASRQAIAVDARETAPSAATQDMFVGNPALSTFGGKAIAVPGELKGLWYLHQRFGKVDWSLLLQPTIHICRDGFELTTAQYNAAVSRKAQLINNTEFQYLFNSQGEVVPAGSKIHRPLLGHTLEVIASEGAGAFYNGTLTDQIVREIQDAGGIITRQDLENYHVDVTDPTTFNLTSPYVTMLSMPPPGSGVVLAYILNILSGYRFSPDSIFSTDKSILTHHRIVEAMKFAYAKRTELGDARFLNISELVANMTSPEFGEAIRAQIDDSRTHNTSYYGPTFYDVVKMSTAHFSLMDGEGNAMSVTSTINTYFGSKVKGNSTGIVYNNEMDDFSTPNTTNYFGVPASKANFIAPGKRPLSSMTPAIFVDRNTGDVRMVVGAAGGTRITTATAKVALNQDCLGVEVKASDVTREQKLQLLMVKMGLWSTHRLIMMWRMVAMDTLWFNKSVVAAVDAPRMHHQLLPPQLILENDFPMEIRKGLEAKGHKIEMDVAASVVTAIDKTEDGMLESVSDFRKFGRPDGF